MKDKQARALAIVALVFMGIFVAALIATIVDYTLFNNAIGFIALGSGVLVFVIFLALKADGRGFSMTKINNEIEMEKIRKAEEEKEAQKRAAEKTSGTASDSNGDINSVAEESRAEKSEAEESRAEESESEDNEVKENKDV